MGMDVLWIKNTDGKKDVMLTFAFVSLSIVLIKVMLGGIPFEILGQTYMLTPIDTGTIAALLTPTLGAYVGRRYTDRKFRDLNGSVVEEPDDLDSFDHTYVKDEDPIPRPMSEV